MARHQHHGGLDDVPVENGDQAFVGVNQRVDPAVLPPGWVSEAKNVRFRNGIIETRRGVMHIAWVNKLVSGSFRPWGEVHGVGRWRNPTNGVEYFVIAADGAVYASYESSTQITVPIPAGETISGTVEFVQCFNVLVMLRGHDANPLAMTTLDNGFESVTKTAMSDETMGVLPLPRALRGVNMANRAFVVPLRETSETEDDETMTAQPGDNVTFSDALDYTRYSINQEFRVNQGDDDTIVQLAAFGKSTLIALKESTVYRIDNVYGNLSSATLSRVTGRYGCAAAKSVVDIGVDLVWLSNDGVASLRQTEFGELQSAYGVDQGIPDMLSADIDPVIKRINWNYAANAVGALWDNRYYLAVPLDDAEIVGEEMVSATAFSLSNVFEVEQGKSYRYVSNGITSSGGSDFESKLVNGSEELTKSGDFVAQGSTVSILRIDDTIVLSDTINDSLKQVTKGINNAVLVYDLLNKAWSGYDEGAEINVKHWIKLRYRNRERLFMVNSEGWVKLYEEDYFDQLSYPYSSMALVSQGTEIPEGDTIQVDGGDVITSANLSAALNGATQFNNNGQIYYFWLPISKNYGYSPAATSGVWDSGSTIGRLIGLNELRFTSTNGLIPSIVTTANPASSLTRSGTTATYVSSVDHGFETGDLVTISGAVESAYNGTFVVTVTNDTTFTYEMESDPGGSATGSPVTSAPWITITEVTTTPIVATIVTRAYGGPRIDRLDYQWASIDIQTWSPSYSVSVLTEGVEEEEEKLTDVTKDRTKWYRPFTKADFEVDNSNGDFMDPHREDYSLELGSLGASEFAVHATSGGVRLDLHQETREGIRISERGRAARLKIVNSDGRIRLMGVRIEGAPEQTRGNTQD